MVKKSKLLIAIFISVAFLFSAQVQAMDIMSSSQLVPGMRGYAKTVIEGTNIETFDIEIIGVIKDSPANEGKIIAKASGDIIDKTGGVIQGMSGSPVYIDGKLIGAVAGGWKDIDSRLCLLTPIGDMLKIWDMPDNKNESKIKQVDLKKPAKKELAIDKNDNQPKKNEIKKEENKNDLPKKAKEDSSVDIKKNSNEKSNSEPQKNVEKDAKEDKNSKPSLKEKESQQLMTPLMVSGFGEAGLSFLQDKLAHYNMMPYASGSSSGHGGGATLKPGSSIGVQIVRGDMSMAAIGTVTAVENGKVLAFGHHFLRKGNVNYFMTEAEIISTASGQSSGFKIGMPGNMVGRINQDRSAAIAGVMGDYPSVVPLRIQVEDAQLGSKKSYDMQIAYDEDLLPTVATAMTYNAIDLSRDRLGSGMAKVSFEIMTNSASKGKFVRDNLFYNVQDVGQIAVSELLQTVNLLATNSMEESDIVAIKVNVKLDESRQTASIVDVTPDKVSVKKGDTVNLKIKIKPYRKPEKILIVPYKVPNTQPSGIANMEARGGGLVPLIQLLLQQQGVDLASDEDKLKPLKAKLDDLAQSNKNNEIVIGMAPMLPEQMAEMNKIATKPDTSPEPVKSEDKGATEKPLKSGAGTPHQPFKHATEYVVDNAKQFVLQIE